MLKPKMALRSWKSKMIEIILTMLSSDRIKGRNGILETVQKDKCSVLTKKKKGEGGEISFFQLFTNIHPTEIM